MSLSRASSTALSFAVESFADVVQVTPDKHASSTARPMLPDDPARGDFSSLYVTWFGGVVQWTRALGVRSSDKYDVAQNVFVVVHRRLPDCDRRNIAGWLYRITARQVRDYRRQRWNQSFFKGYEPVSQDLPSHAPSPAMSLETREAHEVLSNFLSGLGAPTRSAFVLFELYGFTCEEIAALHKVSTNTIWARLRRARKTVLPQLAEWSAHEGKGIA
jgi:RNA polymerase sigma-70 factor, ECF subfamily